MDLNHLHLHVTDPKRSREFYERLFGFHFSRRFGEILFLTNGQGFDLALAPDPSPAGLPDWFHFGFRFDAPDEVRDLHRRMIADPVSEPPGPVHDEPGFLFFRCGDPDRYRIEVYWEGETDRG